MENGVMEGEVRSESTTTNRSDVEEERRKGLKVEFEDQVEFYEEFGGNATFPQVTINGQKMGGCTETVKYLREHNMV